MAVIDIKRTHVMGIKPAKDAVERVAAKISREYGIGHEWDGNRLHFDGGGVRGHIVLARSEVHVRVELGFLMSALKPLIQSEIERQLDKELA